MEKGNTLVSSNVLKIIFVLEMLKKTDELHPVNSTQIIDELKKKGLHAERKSIGKYVKILSEEMGYDIFLSENKNLGWYMTGQEFEEYELKMLVDAVNSAKFLTPKKTKELRNKLLNLATGEGRRVISAGMVTEDSLKLADGQFDLKFDTIMRAIADHKQIQFQYQELVANGHKVDRKNGEKYIVSPYYLGVWGHEYFVVANTKPYDNVSFYRVEMMKNVTTLKEAARSMAEITELKDIGRRGRSFGDFIKENINLWNGPVKRVHLSGENSVQREIFKKFGKDISIRAKGDNRFLAGIEVADSRGFYEWLAQFGNRMRIEEPAECIQGFKQFLLETLEQY